MRITNITAQIRSTPLKTPFKTALRAVSEVKDVYVTVETNSGIIGFGEAAPTAAITGETIPSIMSAIDGYIKPSLVGRDFSEFETMMNTLSKCIIGNTSAKAAVDMALYDIYSQSLKLPLFRFLGGSKTQIQTDVTISVNDDATMLKDTLIALEEGFTSLKIKVGTRGIADADTIIQIRKQIGPIPAIRVDANQGWGPKEAVTIIRLLEDAGADVELVEQPVPAKDLDGLTYVTNNTLTPILADESVFSPADAGEIIRRHAADFINIKLMKTGGIFQALKICSIAEAYGVKCMMGCMCESKASVAAAAHLAAAKAIITMADLDGPHLCKEDPFEGGPSFNGPIIRMTEAPGIGVRFKN
ncbi:MAG: dipeptide epimerase [Clostridiales bacterium]|jgi:o-succinylbenzoate synthase|nr:dipeptide epimerase [Clostridiales bacterium]